MSSKDISLRARELSKGSIQELIGNVEKAYDDYEDYFITEKKLRRTKKEEGKRSKELQERLLALAFNNKDKAQEGVEPIEGKKVYKDIREKIKNLVDSDDYTLFSKLDEKLLVQVDIQASIDDVFTRGATELKEVEDEEVKVEVKVEIEEQKMPDKEVKEEVKKEVKERVKEREAPMKDMDMEEIHNQIRKEERIKTMREFKVGEFKKEGEVGSTPFDIPKERLGVEGKTIKILNDDIKYFLKRFPDNLKTEANVYKKANKRNKKLLLDIHKRIQAKLSSPMEQEATSSERIGIVLDADKYIDSKINELLASKTLKGLTPANLVDITKIPTSKGKDLGSFTVVRQGGKEFIENAPVYRAIPSSNEEQAMKMEEDNKGKIEQSTIYKNSGKTKVDIAKMELRDNPFIKTRKPNRLDIIL